MGYTRLRKGTSPHALREGNVVRHRYLGEEIDIYRDGDGYFVRIPGLPYRSQSYLSLDNSFIRRALRDIENTRIRKGWFGE